MIMRIFFLNKFCRPHTLQFPQHMRHTNVREDQIIPASYPRIAGIISPQISVEPVRSAAIARGFRPGDHGQIRRRCAKPSLSVFFAQVCFHQITYFVRREEEIVADLIFGEPDIAQTVVAHHRGRMAIQAIVHEQTRAILQRGQIAATVWCMVKRVAAFVGNRQCRQQGEHGKKLFQ